MKGINLYNKKDIEKMRQELLKDELIDWQLESVYQEMDEGTLVVTFDGNFMKLAEYETMVDINI